MPKGNRRCEWPSAISSDDCSKGPFQSTSHTLSFAPGATASPTASNSQLSRYIWVWGRKNREWNCSLPPNNVAFLYLKTLSARWLMLFNWLRPRRRGERPRWKRRWLQPLATKWWVKYSKRLDILQLPSLPNHPHNLHRNLKALVQHHPHRPAHQRLRLCRNPMNHQRHRLRSPHRRKLLRNVRQDGRELQQHLNGRKSAVSSKPITSIHQNDHWPIRCVSSLWTDDQEKTNWVDSERGSRLIRLGSRLLIFPICMRFCTVHVNSLVSIVNLW